MKTSIAILLSGVLCLLGLGLVMIFSVEGNASWHSSFRVGTGHELFWEQMFWTGIGLVMMWVAARTDNPCWRGLAVPFFLFAVALLIMVLVPGLGRLERGATRTLPFGPGWLQPSSLAKLAIPLFMAWWFTHDNPDRWWKYAIPVMALVLTVILIGLEPDFSTALLFAIVGLILLVIGGIPLYFVAMVLGCGLCGLAWNICSSAERISRIAAFFSGYEEPRSLWWPWEALKGAGWYGAGLGESRLLRFYYDQAPRDFIIAVIGEELGWTGISFVIVAFVLVIGSGAYISKKADNRFRFLLGLGLVLFIGIQLLLNLAVVTGFLALRIPHLPFVSFSGSGLVLELICVGMLLNLARHASRPSGRGVHEKYIPHP